MRKIIKNNLEALFLFPGIAVWFTVLLIGVLIRNSSSINTLCNLKSSIDDNSIGMYLKESKIMRDFYILSILIYLYIGFIIVTFS